jgi:hypothetical protein
VSVSTNRSVHNKIDNHLLRQSPSHSFDGGPLDAKYGTVTSQQVAARIEAKIEVAKETGDIYNDRFRSYLKKSAEAYGVDLRKFNGYQ